jgi:hypothetical protein
VLIRFTEFTVPSHAGVILPGEMLLHHIGHMDNPVDLSRLAVCEPLGRWVNRKRPGRFLRYVGDQKPRSTL